jgi:hypothetical protein
MFVDAASTSLLQHLRQAQVAQAAKMVATVDEAPDPVGAISMLLQVRRWGLAAPTLGARPAALHSGRPPRWA